MNSDQTNRAPQDMRWDEGDALSRLLGESRLAEPPAWFAARTLALCRQERRPGFVAAARQHAVSIWRWALAGGVAVSMAVAMVVTHVPAQAPQEQPSVQEAFEVVASLDTDSDSSSTASWQDESL